MVLEGAPNAQGGRPAAAGAGSGWGGTGREKAFIVPTPSSFWQPPHDAGKVW